MNARLTGRDRMVARLTVEAIKAFAQELADGISTEGDRDAFVADWVSEGVAEAEQQAAEERETFGYPEDTPSLQSCDMWGTGEGRYHGVIG